MNGKELINSYKTRKDVAKDLNYKIETAQLEIGNLLRKRKAGMLLGEYTAISGKINSLLVDISLCKRKLTNIRQGKKVNGEPEWGDNYGHSYRMPAGD
jgi:hypothetical protein